MATLIDMRAGEIATAVEARRRLVGCIYHRALLDWLVETVASVRADVLGPGPEAAARWAPSAYDTAQLPRLRPAASGGRQWSQP
jgi:hypothetical protein